MVEPAKSWKKSLRDESNPDGLNWWAEAIHMLSVWNMDLDLQTVKVGIIDSMFDITHEDFKEDKFVKVWNNPANQEGVCNVAELYESAANKDEAGTIAHGTHVAGIIAGQAGNGVGITGISQNAELYGFSILSETAFESSPYGFENVGKFLLYMQGAPMNELPDGFKSWLPAYMNPDEEQTLPCYGIYNGAESLLQESLLKYAKKRK